MISTGGGANPGSLGPGSAFGLADITYQGFITPKKAGEIAWGLGGSLVVPTHTKERFGTDKWSAGPAVVGFTTPVGCVVGRLFRLDRKVVAVDVGGYYNVEKPRFANEWYLQILVNFLLPK